MLAAREWAIRLSGAAPPELRFAALVHDAERFIPGGPSSTLKSGFDDPDYLFAHSTRSADIVDRWLDEREEPVALRTSADGCARSSCGMRSVAMPRRISELARENWTLGISGISA
nr:hypothetical protein [Mesorhizobium sp.]